MDQPRDRPPLERDLDVDVVIVGAGYTGLWTAYYLRRADPNVRIAVIEQAHVGFGASGRNGGWCSAIFPVGPRKLVQMHGYEQANALRVAMQEAVDEVGVVAACRGNADRLRQGRMRDARAKPRPAHPCARRRRVRARLRHRGAGSPLPLRRGGPVDHGRAGRVGRDLHPALRSRASRPAWSANSPSEWSGPASQFMNRPPRGRSCPAWSRPTMAASGPI